jgi:hypothetical protein
MSLNETTDNPIGSNINKAHIWRMVFFGLIILIAGIAIGGSAMLIFAPNKLLQPPPGPEFRSLRMIPPLRRDLGLSPEQAEKIKPILDKHMKKLNTIRTEARSEVAETLKQMNQEIAAILTDQQQQRWRHEISRLQDELRPRGGPGPRRRGGGPARRRFRGGQQERPGRGMGPGGRGPGPFGSRRRMAEPNTPQDEPIEPEEPQQEPPQQEL